jgi:hypothetical protein
MMVERDYRNGMPGRYELDIQTTPEGKFVVPALMAYMTAVTAFGAVKEDGTLLMSPEQAEAFQKHYGGLVNLRVLQ